MNKNYTKALINEMFDQKILNSEDDRARIKELIALYDNDFTGCFEDDLEALKEVWEEDQKEEETAPTLEEIVENLHVGLNFIPGLGVAYAADEEDLAKMKKHLQGWLVIEAALQAIFED